MKIVHRARFSHPRGALNPSGFRIAAAVDVEIFESKANTWKAREATKGKLLPIPQAVFPSEDAVKAATAELFEQQLTPWQSFDVSTTAPDQPISDAERKARQFQPPPQAKIYRTTEQLLKNEQRSRERKSGVLEMPAPGDAHPRPIEPDNPFLSRMPWQHPPEKAPEEETEAPAEEPEPTPPSATVPAPPTQPPAQQAPEQPALFLPEPPENLIEMRRPREDQIDYGKIWPHIARDAKLMHAVNCPGRDIVPGLPDLIMTVCGLGVPPTQAVRFDWAMKNHGPNISCMACEIQIGRIVEANQKGRPEDAHT